MHTSNEVSHQTSVNQFGCKTRCSRRSKIIDPEGEITTTIMTRRDNMKFWMIAALLLTASFAQPQATESPDPPFTRLASVKYFALGPVGYAGHMSEGEKDFNLIMSRASAVQDFERLFTAGNVQAKAYALAGLHQLKSARFKELAEPLRSSKITVNTMHGCIGGPEPMRDVIGEIERVEANWASPAQR